MIIYGVVFAILFSYNLILYAVRVSMLCLHYKRHET